eukprot:SAG31_NODE_2577_length_5451_cov_3.176757_2_plen_92_part_00
MQPDRRAKLTDGANAVDNANGWGVAASVSGSSNVEVDFDLGDFFEICGLSMQWETGNNAHVRGPQLIFCTQPIKCNSGLARSGRMTSGCML